MMMGVRAWMGWVVVLGLLVMMGALRAQGGTTPAPSAGPAAPAIPSVGDYLKEGDKMLKARDFPKALSLFVMGWLQTPDNPVIIDRIGDVYFEMGKMPEATRFYACAVKLNPNLEEPTVSLAHAYLRLNRADQAVALLEDPQRMKTFEKSLFYLHVLGVTYERLGKYDKALNVLQSAMQLTPDASFVLGDLGNTYYLMGKYAEAVDYYTKALAKNPLDVTALLNKSMAQEKQQKYAEAVATLEQYLTLTKAPDEHPQRKRLAELKAKVKP